MKTPQDHLKIYISERLEKDLAGLYKDFTGEELSGTRRKKVLFICSTIHMWRVRKQLSEFEWVEIPSSFWKKTLGRDYDLISNILPSIPLPTDKRFKLKGADWKATLIERSSYEPLGFTESLKKGVSYGYKLSPKYAKNTKVRYLKYPTLARKLKDIRVKRLQAIFRKHANYRYLYECQNLITFSSKVNFYLRKLELETDSRRRQTAEGLVNILKNHEEEEYTFSLSERTGRVFYIPNYMNSALRPYIQLNGEPTEEIDIPASQPLFLSLLYPKKAQAEKAEYLKLVRSGKFYETLQRWTPKYSYLSRGELKERVFQQIFFSKNYKNTPQLMKTFTEHYPTIAKVIWKEKSVDHTKFACRIQKLESDFIIKKVVTHLRMESIPCLCVHDSVIVPKSQAKVIRKWFFDELDKVLGL